MMEGERKGAGSEGEGEGVWDESNLGE